MIQEEARMTLQIKLIVEPHNNFFETEMICRIGCNFFVEAIHNGAIWEKNTNS